MEDAVNLISAVHSYSPLWDIRDKRYHSRHIQRRLWVKVAEELDSDVASLKKKWKGLRDFFRKEHKKLRKLGLEAPDELVSSWPYFDQMLFLSDIMQPKELKRNLSAPFNPIGGVNDLQKYENLKEELEQSSATYDKGSGSGTVKPIIMAPPPATPSTKKRKRLTCDENNGAEKNETNFKKGNRKADHFNAQFLKIEKEKLKLFSESTSMNGDSDYQFLLSLLPYLKKVPEPRKLIVRHRLQQVLIDEEHLIGTFQCQQPSASCASQYEVAQPLSGPRVENPH